MPPGFPTSPEQLTDAWLTLTLRAAGAISGVSVAGHRVESLSAQRATSDLVRISLAYDGDRVAAPQTLIAKFASSDAAGRAELRGFGGDRREIEFYRHFGHDPGIPVPACFAAEFDEHSGDYVLILEDLAAGRRPDWWALVPNDVSLIVEFLAPFHARWWRSPRILSHDWLRRMGDSVAPSATRAGAVYELLDRHGERVPVSLADALIAVARATPRHPTSLGQRPFTLIHGDIHGGNVVLPNERSGRFAVFDWSHAAVGAGPIDLARMLVLGLTIDARRSLERPLLERYRELLIENGVIGYGFAQCLEDYRLGVLLLLADLSYWAPDPVQERCEPTALFAQTMERAAAAVSDLSPTALLD